MRIRILKPNVASQIAAGEVVERPGSVVKELIENSIDSGSQKIAISIKQTGKQLIRVSDNGNGIPPDELELAIMRHSTSKLSTPEDLININTLGFRGEALASIASISKMTVISRIRKQEHAARIHVEGGNVSKIDKIGANVGTTVEVKDLFYNVPARLKFLKTDRTEKQVINQIVINYAVGYGEKQFIIEYDGRVGLQTSGKNDQQELLGLLYGIENSRKMLEVVSDFEKIAISGYVSPINLSKSNRKDIHFFINRRPVHDTTLNAAFVKAYHTMLMVGRFPFGVIHLEMDPELVDVNVHPTKAEVRFLDRNDVFRTVSLAVKRALLAHTPANNHNYPREKNYWSNYPPDGNSFEFQEKAGFSFDRSADEKIGQETRPSQIDMGDMDLALLRVVGQIGNTYIVAEGPDGLYLIDQHAAHERVLFEDAVRRKTDQAKRSEIDIQKSLDGVESYPTNGENISQALIDPVVLEFSIRDYSTIINQYTILSNLGFDIEDFGNNSFIIRAIPRMLIGTEPESAINILIDDFEEDEKPFEHQQESKFIARICKRVAIKAGQKLSVIEQEKLVYDLEQCESPRTCPHGRPTMIHFPVGLLERQFGRKGAR